MSCVVFYFMSIRSLTPVSFHILSLAPCSAVTLPSLAHLPPIPLINHLHTNLCVPCSLVACLLCLCFQLFLLSVFLPSASVWILLAWFCGYYSEIHATSFSNGWKHVYCHVKALSNSAGLWMQTVLIKLPCSSCDAHWRAAAKMVNTFFWASQTT